PGSQNSGPQGQVLGESTTVPVSITAPNTPPAVEPCGPAVNPLVVYIAYIILLILGGFGLRKYQASVRYAFSTILFVAALLLWRFSGCAYVGLTVPMVLSAIFVLSLMAEALFGPKNS